MPSAPSPAAAAPKKKTLVLVVVAVLIVAGLAAVAFVLLGGPAPGATLDRVEVSATRTSLDEGTQVRAVAVAIDSSGTNRTADATIAWSSSPAGRLTLAGATTPLVTATAIEDGAVTLTATATLSGVTRQANLTLTVRALSFVVTATDTTPDVGQPIDITVEAVYESNQTTVTSYTGEVEFSSPDDPGATLPGPTRFVSADQGLRTFTGIALSEPEPARIQVSDTLAAIFGEVIVTGQQIPGAPSASFTVTRTLMHVDVDASASSDPENDIQTYEWDFQNDGTFDGTGVTASFDYTAPDRYVIRLRLTDATGNTGNATRQVSVNTTTIDFEYYDFFNVPFGEWWDYRFATYGDLPINAECFNQTAIDNGICPVSRPTVADVASYPYTNWYPAPGPLQPTNPNNNPFIYAPYRFRVAAVNVPGYNLSEPVFLPVLNYGAAPGTRLDFAWSMDYVDTARAATVDNDCGTNLVSGMDGFIIESTVTLTMDLAESRRLFGVVAVDQTTAQAWWATNANPNCALKGPVESAVETWFVQNGGSQSQLGKYDIASSFEYWYTPFLTQLDAVIDADGTTHVTMSHVAWGTEVLLARMSYWGNTSYRQFHLDSTRATGWWGMELAWFEEFSFAGTLGASRLDFNLSSVMQYHFQQLASPGPDGQWDASGDVPYWTWGPILSDYANDWAPAHPISELDRYPVVTYVHSTPGGQNYGEDNLFDVVPVTWDLVAGETWHFTVPSGNVRFYDPNLTPKGANPIAGAYVAIDAPLVFARTAPPSYGTFGASSWDVLGPAVSGGPAGSPGNYALESWPSVSFEPPAGSFAPPAQVGPSGIAVGPAQASAVPHPRLAAPRASGSGTREPD